MATDELFVQAAKDWDLDTLYADLASAKGKRLTPIEKLHLRGLLLGHSPAEIAERLNKNVKGLEVNFCNTIYQYVKNLLGKGSEKVENWRNICEWLEEAGYKNQSSPQFQVSDGLSLDIAVNKFQTIATKPRGRDFVDLYLINRTYGYKMEDLAKKARAKFDWYVNPLQLAANFLLAKEVSDLPKMRIPLKADEWRGYFLTKAKELKTEVF